MSKRTYDWNGHKGLPISFPDLTDEQMAGTVRMLMRHDLSHEGIVCGARDRIMCLVKENAAKDAEIAKLREALRQITEMESWQFGVPADTEAASEHARIAACMADVARVACNGGSNDCEVSRLRMALEPFALISIEGVAKVSNGYCTVTTQAEYFHAARAALEGGAQ